MKLIGNLNLVQIIAAISIVSNRNCALDLIIASGHSQSICVLAISTTDNDVTLSVIDNDIHKAVALAIQLNMALNGACSKLISIQSKVTSVFNDAVFRAIILSNSQGSLLSH